MAFKILHGGRVRFTGVTSGTRNKGVAAYIAATAGSELVTLATYNGTQAKPLVGPSLEKVVASNAIMDSDSVVTGMEGSILLDTAMCETDQIASGTTLAVGDAVFFNSTGLLAASGVGTAFAGWCTRNSGSDGIARYLYTPQRWGY